MAQTNQASKGGELRAWDHQSQRKGLFDAEETLDPRSMTSSKLEAAGLEASDGVAMSQCAQGVVAMTENDDCNALFIAIRQTLGCFAVTCELHRKEKSETARSESHLPSSQATRAGIDS